MPLGLTLPQRAGRAQGRYFFFGGAPWAAGLFAIFPEAFAATGLAAGFCSWHAGDVRLTRCKTRLALRLTARLAGRRAAARAGLSAEMTAGTDAGKEKSASSGRSILGAAFVERGAAFAGAAAATAGRGAAGGVVWAGLYARTYTTMGAAAIASGAGAFAGVSFFPVWTKTVKRPGASSTVIAPQRLGALSPSRRMRSTLKLVLRGLAWQSGFLLTQT